MQPRVEAITESGVETVVAEVTLRAQRCKRQDCR